VLIQHIHPQPSPKDAPDQHDDAQIKGPHPALHNSEFDAPPFPPTPRGGKRKRDDDNDAPLPVAKKANIDTPENDVWVTAYNHNIRESALCRLPNELIGMITSHLPEESKYLLKQCSRRFNAVYTGPGFSRLRPLLAHSPPYGGSFGQLQPQTVSSLSTHGGLSQTHQTRFQTGLNWLVGAPHTVGGSNTYSATLAPVLGGLFSSANVPSVPLFGHSRTMNEGGMFNSPIYWNRSDRTLSSEPYGQRISVYESRKELQALIRKDIYCRHCLSVIAGEGLTSWREYHLTRLQRPLHCSGCARNHPTVLFSISQRKKDDNQRICIGREGHVRICAHKTVSWSDVEEYVTDHTGKDNMLVQCQHESHCRDGWPSFRMSYHHDLRCASPSIHWQVRPLDVRWGQPKTVGQIRDNLRIEDLAATTALCPHESFEDISFLLRPFDPHHCTCTRPHATFPSIHEKKKGCTSFLEPELTKCCRCDCYEQGGVHEGKFLAPRPLRNPDQARFSTISRVEHSCSCESCGTGYTWLRSGDAVNLRRSSEAFGGVKSPYQYRWISLLDPSSYDIKEPEMRHTLWCDSPKCATTRHWRQQKVLAAITKALLVEGQWGEPTPEERARSWDRSPFSPKNRALNSQSLASHLSPAVGAAPFPDTK
jgi:hypothetical protein